MLASDILAEQECSPKTPKREQHSKRADSLNKAQPRLMMHTFSIFSSRFTTSNAATDRNYVPAYQRAHAAHQ